MNDSKHIVVTGAAGFVGSHLTETLLSQGHRVTGIDNFDPFYSRKIKENNISGIGDHPLFDLLSLDITDYPVLFSHFPKNVDVIVHLAAKAGVRPSIDQPIEYQRNNVLGTQHLLEIARERNIRQFVFGSSSSVYGVNENVPWKESDSVLLPISPYASSKVAGELLGHVYAHLHDIRFIALRFFTVYGPRQRPDLAIHKFFRMIDQGQPIPVFGEGQTYRDYTYIADIVSGIMSAVDYTKTNFEIINLGNHQTVSLTHLIGEIEDISGQKARINRLPLQPGDVPKTYADISKARDLLGYEPKTELKSGLKSFYNWYKAQAARVSRV